MAGKKGTKYYASRRLDTTKIVLILIISKYIRVYLSFTTVGKRQ